VRNLKILKFLGFTKQNHVSVQTDKGELEANLVEVLSHLLERTQALEAEIESRIGLTAPKSAQARTQYASLQLTTRVSDQAHECLLQAFRLMDENNIQGALARVLEARFADPQLTAYEKDFRAHASTLL